MKNKRRTMGIIVLSLFMLLLIAIPLKNYTTELVYKINNYLPNNLYVDNFHLGGKTLEQTKDELTKLEKLQLKKSITIIYDADGYSQRKTFSYEQLGYYADYPAIMNQLNTIIDKNINIFNRFINYRKIERNRADFTIPYNMHYDIFLKALKVFDNSKLKPPIDAKYSIRDGRVQIIHEEYGYAIDKDVLFKELLANRNLETAKLKFKAIKPAITTELLEAQGVEELISSFMTRFDAGNFPRASNIRLAASIIEGTILPPGSTFSFNEIVGKRTEERGFKEAGVYINGKLDTGIGGGICQVSTTLYNAVLLADLEVIERSNHSLTVPYVPLSRDAAVSWGAQDFRFVNNTKNYIYIHAATTKGTITFALYSTKINKRIELVSTTLSKTKAPVQYIDDEAALIGKEYVIDKGHDGYQSQLTKTVYIDGKKVSSELVSKDKYLPAIKIIKRGTKPPEAMLDIDDEI